MLQTDRRGRLGDICQAEMSLRTKSQRERTGGEIVKQEEPKIHLYKRNLGAGGRKYKENTLGTHRIFLN